MLRTNKLKLAIQEQQPAYGLFCSIPSPLIVEIVACAGYDFVILDLEHTLTSASELAHLLRAAEAADVTALVRVPPAAPHWAVRVLDAGAQGIVFPRVTSAEDLAAAVRSCRYFPLGERGLNAGRLAAFGKMPLDDYLERANRETLVVAMIEDTAALQRLDSISATPGLDMLLEGAADLSQSLGVPWQTRSAAVKRGLEDMCRAAQRHGVAFCALPRVDEDYDEWWQKGVRVFVTGDDRGLMFRHLRDRLKALRTRADRQAG